LFGGDRMKKKILIMAGYYLPSVKGGGPIRSIRNLVDNLGDSVDFYILAADRDLGDEKPFNDIIVDKWTKVYKAQVYYTDMHLLNWRKVKSIIDDIDCDILYLNSFFAFKDSIIPILLQKINAITNIKIIIAPRGQFSKGALGLKSWKKKIFVKTAKLIDLYKNVEWHATTLYEKEDIQSVFGRDIRVYTANNMTKNYGDLHLDKTLEKKAGILKLVYIARIHPMKNLLQALEILQKIKGNIEFNIYGPIEDKPYWEKCQNTISQMRENIKVNYYGPISNEKVNDIYQQNHVAILLTLGENFGHSIAEALIGGCPVIISDKTPWKSLEKYNAGYDLALNNEDSLIDAINHYIEMDHHDYKKNSMSAFEYARRKSNTVENINEYYKMFDSLN
jgi:glycosyltransferase involved in cell wall biosynthesis